MAGQQGIVGDGDVRLDETNQIRIIDEATLKNSCQLQHLSQEFMTQITRFDELTSSFLEVMDSKARQIDNEKLKAIGLRNRVEGANLSLERAKRELEAAESQRAAVLEQLSREYESLVRVEADQKIMLDRLTMSDL
ncbi:intraflagellar transport protein 20 [Pelomyxa schiedti]|nr:intraflagellar transport protein 20 [Pelomyxa schiedti]